MTPLKFLSHHEHHRYRIDEFDAVEFVKDPQEFIQMLLEYAQDVDEEENHPDYYSLSFNEKTLVSFSLLPQVA